MSAILVLRQRSAVHLLADAASYDRQSGRLISNNLAKCIALPTLGAAISCTGPADLGAYIGYHCAQLFSSFDDMIARGEQVIPILFNEFADERRAGDALGSLYIIGWHSAAARPAAYAMNMWSEDSSHLAQVRANSRSQPKPFAFSEQLVSGTPLPSAALLAAAGMWIPDDENDMKPELDLLHLMEIQRHEEIEGKHWVGGKALLTSIDQDGITQRVLHHWIEDVIGQPIKPLPIDWESWRSSRAMAAAGVSAAGLSPLQRRRMEKKARKGTL